jgi:hypothetical protein
VVFLGSDVSPSIDDARYFGRGFFETGLVQQNAGRSMDALSDVLRVVRLDGGVFLRAEFTAPWCIRS